jgi:hypothetical protein
MPAPTNRVKRNTVRVGKPIFWMLFWMLMFQVAAADQFGRQGAP